MSDIILSVVLFCLYFSISYAIAFPDAAVSEPVESVDSIEFNDLTDELDSEESGDWGTPAAMSFIPDDFEDEAIDDVSDSDVQSETITLDELKKIPIKKLRKIARGRISGFMQMNANVLRERLLMSRLTRTELDTLTAL